MNRIPSTLVAFFLVSLLSGCAAFPPPPRSKPTCVSPPDDSSRTDTATLRYYRTASSYDTARLRGEFAQRLRALEPSVCDQHRLEAGALTVLEPELDDKYPGLLQPCLDSPDPEKANMALLLHDQLAQHRRQSKQQAELRQEIAKLKAENESVRKQLNALKDIEKSIHERDTRPSSRTNP